jgi:hypothetical protein
MEFREHFSGASGRTPDFDDERLRLKVYPIQSGSFGQED